MADANSILNIIVRLQDEASQQIQSFSNKLQELEPQFKTMRNVGVAGFAAISGAVGISVSQFIKAGDEMQKMAIRTGFTTKSLSELKYAADLSGTSIEAMESQINRMNRVLLSADEESKGAQQAIERLGLSIGDIVKLSPEQRFFKIANAVAAIQDPGVRAAAAMGVFGRAGTELLPLLSEGTEGLQKMRDEANKLGVVFDQQTADAAARFQDDMTRLSQSFAGARNQLATALLPALTQLVTTLVPIINSVKDWITEHPKLTVIITIGTAALLALLAVLGSIGLILPGLIIAFGAITGGMVLMAAQVGIVIGVLIALGVWFKWLWENSDKVVNALIEGWKRWRDFWIEMWNAIKNFFSNIWEGIKGIFQSAIDWMMAKLQPLLNAIAAVRDGFNSVTSYVGSNFQAAGQIIGQNVNAAAGAVGNFFGFADGGIVTRPTMGLVGEAGPEAIIPLSQAGGLGGTTINIYGDVSGEELIEKVKQGLMRSLRFDTKIGGL